MGICKNLLGVTGWLCLALEWNENTDGREGLQLPRACDVKGIALESYLNWETQNGFTLKYVTSILLPFDLRVCTPVITSRVFSNHNSSSISKHCLCFLPCHSQNISVSLPAAWCRVSWLWSCSWMSRYSVWDVPGNYVYKMPSIGLHNFCWQINLVINFVMVTDDLG